jgi:hypothetical protein
MSTIRFAMFLLYRYYKHGRWEKLPYFHALCSIAFLLFLNIAAFLCFIKQALWLFGGNKETFIIKFVLLFIVFVAASWIVAPEQELQTAKHDDAKIRKGYLVLILYVLLSIALLLLGIFFKRQ